MVVGKVVVHLCLTLIIKELKISVEHDRVVTTLNIIFSVARQVGSQDPTHRKVGNKPHLASRGFLNKVGPTGSKSRRIASTLSVMFIRLIGTWGGEFDFKKERW